MVFGVNTRNFAEISPSMKFDSCDQSCFDGVSYLSSCNLLLMLNHLILQSHKTCVFAFLSFLKSKPFFYFYFLAFGMQAFHVWVCISLSRKWIIMSCYVECCWQLCVFPICYGKRTHRWIQFLLLHALTGSIVFFF